MVTDEESSDRFVVVGVDLLDDLQGAIEHTVR